MGTLHLHLEGKGEGSFDINIGTKKQSLSAQEDIFSSIGIVCFGRISFCNLLLAPSSLACQLSHYLSLQPPSILAVPPSQSPVAPPSSIPPRRLMTSLMTGNEFSNVNCKGLQGKTWGGAAGTESPGWWRVGVGGGGSSRRQRHEVCV